MVNLQANDLFEAETSSLWETFMAHNSSAGYKIPEYQREYTWDENNIDRLLEDCLNGFSRLSQAGQQGFTFLGSIILTRGGREATFDGVSLWVIDGQQRLTSLILTACSLFHLITTHRNDIAGSDTALQDWLNAECDLQLVSLRQCALGQIHRLDGDVFYPRLVRMEDRRGSSSRESKYESSIARFLTALETYSANHLSVFPPKAVPGSSDDHMLSTYEHLYQRLSDYLYHNKFKDDDGPIDVSTVERTSFKLPGYAALWRKLDETSQQMQDQQVDLMAKPSACEGLARILLFSSYFMQRVVLTRVESQDEEYAFDMFDSLNTTGEPLTALETFKPLVVVFENRCGSGYSGSKSQGRWDGLDGTLTSTYPDPSRRQNESKWMLTSFALYLDGYRLPLDAASQRSYLRDRFRRAEQSSMEHARAFVDGLARVGEFRAQYWEVAAINALGTGALGAADSDTLRLCLRFIADTKTTLAIPILARYWVRHGDADKNSTLLRATKAVAAFLALRRATTAGTAGIDSDFRKLMKNQPAAGGHPLSAGITLSNDVMAVEDLQAEFRRFLQRLDIDFENEDTWIKKAEELDLGARAPQALNRFLLFAAHHNARRKDGQPGMLTRGNVVSGSDIAFFTHRNWVDPKYATVEHVAPESDRGAGWQAEIYRRQITRNLLGNLVLLPERENQAIGNAPWAKKKAFYAALASKDHGEREDFLEEAKKGGYGFGRKTENLLRGQERLNLLDPVVAVDEWTDEIIQSRTRNILSLAWAQVAPWLMSSSNVQDPPGRRTPD